MKSKKIKIKKTEKVFKKVPLFLVKHAFEVALVLFLLALLIGLAVFYRYNFLTKKNEIEISGQVCPLEDIVYTNVLGVWKKHDQMSEQTDTKDYYNMFLIEVD